MSAYSSAVLALTPQAYYRLDETSGTIAHDISGNGNNGVLNGVLIYNAVGALYADPNTCIGFSALGGVVIPSALYTPLTACTLVFWVYLGAWYMIVTTTANIDGITQFYENGMPVANNRIGLVGIDTDIYYGGIPYAMYLDEVALFNYRLSLQQIKNLQSLAMAPWPVAPGGGFFIGNGSWTAMGQNAGSFYSGTTGSF